MIRAQKTATYQIICKQRNIFPSVDVASVYRTMDEMHEVSLRVHHSVVWTVMRVSETVWTNTGCTQVTLAEGSELDDYRQVLIRAATIESCLRAEALGGIRHSPSIFLLQKSMVVYV